MIVKILNIISLATIIITFLLFGFLAYLLFEPFTPPWLGNGDIPILNKNHTIKEGETITTKIDYCIYRGVPSTSTKRYEQLDGDKRVYFLATTVSDGKDKKTGKALKNICGSITSTNTTTYITSNVKSSENTTVPNTSTIPGDIPPGKYRIIITSIFQVNPLKTVTANYQTQEFFVVK